ncbi:uncharacterized protein LOC129773112 [Toxorhynchites rutilus septentrionalis]|uniref:uncharacterized protein LOC129773112 n=1 Tax=Toxorhynchites rutilus septentrionalis TaxID=329112 RepID=UPI002479BCDD|nr:uncharacterized protein LOC129773112 [Toxorhynchites rutilus septentrionalis]
MYFILSVLLLACITFSTPFATAPPNSAAFVGDLMMFLRVPLKVTLFVCWSEEKSFQFVRHAFSSRSGNTFSIQVKNYSVESLAFLDTMEPHQQLAVVDIMCPETRTFLEMARYRLYHRVRWIMLDSSEFREKSILDIVSGLPVFCGSEVYYFVGTKTPNQFLIKEVYRASMQTSLLVASVGVWRNNSIEDKRVERSISTRRRNLRQLEIRTTYVYTDNYTLSHFDDYENTQINTASRFCYHLLKVLYVHYLNATIGKQYATTWGYPDRKTGLFGDGMCGDVINNRSEVGGTLLFFSPERMKYLDYTKIPIETSLRFVFRAPKLSTTSNIFRLPFDSNVWCSLSGLLLIMVLLFVGVGAVSKKKSRRQINRENLLDAAFDVIPVALQQGSMIEAKTETRRILVLVSLLGLMFLYVSFSARIVSLIQAPSQQIASVRDLLNSRLEVAGHDLPYHRFYLSKAREPVRQALIEQKIVRKDGSLNMYSLEEGVKRIRKGLFAFHVHNTVAYRMISETFDDVETCQLRELNFVSDTDGYIPLQRNFTLREHFNVGLIKIVETGVFNRQWKRIYAPKPTCAGGIAFLPLTAVDTGFAVEVIGWGMMVAIVLLAGEIGWRRYRIRRLQLFPYVE